jgi:hypothetical protein
VSDSRIKATVRCEWPEIGCVRYNVGLNDEPLAGQTIDLQLRKDGDGQFPPYREFKILKVVPLNSPPDSTTGHLPFGFIQEKIEMHLEPVD